MFSEPAEGAVVSSCRDALVMLAGAHRGYVDVWPDRFAAIAQLTSEAIFGDEALRGLLVARHRRSRDVVALHLQRLSATGVVSGDADIRAVASGFVDACVGIELCFLLDGDDPERYDAYRHTCLAFAQRLGARLARRLIAAGS